MDRSRVDIMVPFTNFLQSVRFDNYSSGSSKDRRRLSPIGSEIKGYSVFLLDVLMSNKIRNYHCYWTVSSIKVEKTNSENFKREVILR